MFKSYRSSLEKKFTYTLGGFAVFVALLVGSFGHYINEQLEVEIWRATLESEFLYYKNNRTRNSGQSVYQSGNLQIYSLRNGEVLNGTIPNQLSQLRPGIYDEIEIGGREYCVLVRALDKERILLAYDITHLEESEFKLAILIIGLVFISLIGIIYMSHVLGRMLVAPIKDMADKVNNLNPKNRGSEIGDIYKESELSVIANAIDTYLARLDEFVDREKEFLDTASHELRTPITIISGAADILNARPDSEEIKERAISRIKQATKDITDSISALFVLAKDETQLANSAKTLRLDTLIEKTVREHIAIFPDKVINVHLDLDETCIFAPKEAASIVLRNLIRNAIEHSENDEISIKIMNGIFQIENQGNQLTPEHIASLFNKRIRGKGGEGNGLGLYLIKRICECLKWKLDISGLEINQFIVKLDLSRHLIADANVK